MKSINKIIKIFIYSDLLVLSGFGFLAPIFAIFIKQQIMGNSTEIAGFAAAIYWLIKSALQIPIGLYLDKNHGEKDDLCFVVIGLILAALAPLGFIFASSPWHIYLWQSLYAIGMALAFPAWLAIFTRHIDKDREAFEWSLYNTSTGIGLGIAGALGGILASAFGFKIVFIFVSTLALIGALLPIFSYKHLKDKLCREQD